MTTFHLLEKTFVAIFCNGMTDVVVRRRDNLSVGEPVHLVNENLSASGTAEISDIRYHEKHPELVTISISNVENIHYDTSTPAQPALPDMRL